MAFSLTHDFSKALQLGRQQQGESPPFALSPLPKGLGSRLVIAHEHETEISREFVKISADEVGFLTLTNLSQYLPVVLEDGRTVRPGHTIDGLTVPITLNLRQKAVTIGPSEPTSSQSTKTLEVATPTPGRKSALVTQVEGRLNLSTVSENPDVEVLISRLQVALSVMQSVVGSTDFFNEAVEAMVRIVGLDSARGLLYAEGNWQEKAASKGGDRNASRSLLTRLLTEKRTLWEEPSQNGAMSLAGLEAVVASPILDRHGQVIGALYGERQFGPTTFPHISRLEAMLVELLASGIAAGLARMEHEKTALEAQVRFEQFFSRDLAEELIGQDNLLDGRECDVTVLFVDVHRFSTITVNMGPAATIEFINDVLGSLSDCVLDHGGVLVDYVGDELMAMWGAPRREPNHAKLACQAALAMLARRPELQERWGDKLGVPLDFSIGINSGLAQVGNVGSHHKFKYGPLGNTVNLGSRTQGVNKFLGTKVLVTQSTRDRLDESFCLRRLCSVQVVNIEMPVDLYELVPPETPNWKSVRDQYEEALALFERKKGESLGDVIRTLGDLVARHPDDEPSLVLLARAVDFMVAKRDTYDSVWQLSGK